MGEALDGVHGGRQHDSSVRTKELLDSIKGTGMGWDSLPCEIKSDSIRGKGGPRGRGGQV